jgi:hypothetical protein
MIMNIKRRILAALSAASLLASPAFAGNLVVDGHVIASGTGTAPALTVCGTTPAIVGSDTAGTVTMGTGTPTGCVITFNVAYATAPACVVIWQGTPLTAQNYTVSAIAITTVQTATNSNKVSYICMAASGG